MTTAPHPDQVIPALTKTLRNGKQADITITCSPGRRRVSSTVDGREIGGCYSPPQRSARGLPTGHVASWAGVALTEAETVAAEAAWRLAGDVVAEMPPNLADERARLVHAYTDAVAVAVELRDSAFDHGVLAEHLQRHHLAEKAAVEAARAALTAFDAAHPEIAAGTA